MIKHNDRCRKKWQTVPGGFYCPVHKDFIDNEDEFLDDMKKIMANEGKTCLSCVHFDGKFSCPAFPEVIPEPFLVGREIHKKPKYGQTNKIVFEPKNG